jgi:hypothetical protein
MTNLKQDQKTMWIYAKNTDKDKTNMDMLIHTSKNIIMCLLQDLIVALEQIGNLASRNKQLVRIILMQDPMIHTLMYVLVLELPYQM